MRVLWITAAICILLVVCFFLLQRVLSTAEREEPQMAAAQIAPAREAEPAVRRPAVAGAFYPHNPRELEAMVDGYLDAAAPGELPGELVGVIAPHAGFIFSGPVAGYSYAPLRGKRWDTVVVVGPSHGARHGGAALPGVDFWETPLGRVPINADLARKLMDLDERFTVNDRVQQQEHSLEVQLPFLQRALGEFRLLPVQVWDASVENCAAVARALAAAVQDEDVLLVASTDLSHYPEYEAAVRTDRRTLDLISDWRLTALPEWEREAVASDVPELHCTLCGLSAVLVVMEAARLLGASDARVLNYANSGDVPAGDRLRCVGYAAVALCRVEGKPALEEGLPAPDTEKGGTVEMKHSPGELTEEQQDYLVELARRAVEQWVTRRVKVEPDRREGIFGEKRAVFVTIEEHGRLRGCIGSLTPQEPLVDAVVSRAIAAATQDPRFVPVQPDELPSLAVKVSVLSPVKAVADPSEIEVGTHGVIVSEGGRSGVFLPEVAVEQGWDRETMLSILCRDKAGLTEDAWQRGAKLEVFTTQVFGEVG